MTQTLGNKPQADDTIVAWQKWDIRPNWKHQMLHSLHCAASKASTWLQQGNSLAASGAHLCSCTFIRELPHAKLHKSLSTVCPQVDIWFRPDLVTLLSNFSRIHQVFESRFLLSGKSGLPVELVGGLNSVLGSSGLTPSLLLSRSVLWTPDYRLTWVTAAEDGPLKGGKQHTKLLSMPEMLNSFNPRASKWTRQSQPLEQEPEPRTSPKSSRNLHYINRKRQIAFPWSFCLESYIFQMWRCWSPTDDTEKSLNSEYHEALLESGTTGSDSMVLHRAFWILGKCFNQFPGADTVCIWG